jgi:O-antigen/teichoic acid export membrane protein
MQLKQPLKNTVAIGSADLLSRFLGFVATAYLARRLGASSFGLISIGFSVLGYVTLFSSPGLHIMGIRRVAASSESERLWTGDVTMLRFLLSVAGVLLATTLSFVILGPTSVWVMIVFWSCGAIPLALSLDWYFQGRSDLGPASLGRVLIYVVYLAGIFLAVRSPEDVNGTAIAWFTANVAGAVLLGVVFARRVGPLELRWQPRKWVPLLRESLPLGLSTILGQTIVNMPVILVGALLTSSETGFFSAAMKLIFFVLMIDRVFYTLFLPVVSRYRARGDAEFSRAATLGMKVMLVFSLPVMVIGMSYAETFITLVYGPGYEPAAPVLQWALPYVLCTTMNTVLMSVMYADQRDAEFLRIMAIGTVLIVVLCTVLPPLLGVQGSAIGLSVGEGVMTAMLLFKVRSVLPWRRSTTLLPMFAGAVGMGCTTLVFSHFPVALVLPFACVVFALTVLAMRGLSREDLRFLWGRFV